jgi:adenylate cyclase
MRRRLSAILAADMVGYSRLMGADEEGTLKRHRRHRSELIDPTIKACHGRIVKTMGDGLLVEFPSVVDAANCAVAIQTAMSEREGDIPEDARIRYRIGINLGDVITDGDDILGDGVNIAARLEGLAEPGGVCISDIVFQSVRAKIDATFEDLGKQQLKNIDQPIRVWRWPGLQADHAETITHKPPVLPDKPSIAVLAFDNLSVDADQEYLADGISEDLITALSKIRWFIVIARNSSFAYKGEAISVSQIARDLDVRYVLEGSVRRVGSRVRVTAQLVDATSGSQVWAERYDRDIEDIFALQDEMTQTIVSAVDAEISAAERERATRKSPNSLDVWEIYQRGLWHLWRFNPADVNESIRLFRCASKLDPSFAPAYAYEAYADFVNIIQGYVERSEMNLESALEAAKTAVELDSKDAIAHFALGRILTIRGELDAAISALNEAVNLNPNLAQAYHGLGWALELSGYLDEAIEAFSIAIKLSPRDPRVWATMVFMSLAYILKEDFETASNWALKAKRIPTDRGYWSSATLAAAQANMGMLDEAKATIKEALERKPDLSLGYLRTSLLFDNREVLGPYLRGLRAAGLPD